MKAISELEQTPIVNTAFSYGLKQGHNEVLEDFISSEATICSSEGEGNVFQHLL